MNIEQEIWNDFKSLSESSLMDRLSYGTAAAHYGLSYDDRNCLVSNGLNKRLAFDEDYKINQFLLKSDHKNVNWDELLKLYPAHENIDLGDFYKPKWAKDKEKLYGKIPNDNSAKEYLIHMRWEGSPACPRCESKRLWILSNTQ